MNKLRRVILASASFLVLSTPVVAQEVTTVGVSEADDTDSKATDADIVVTGTLIRGQAPTGSQIVQVDSAEIATQGIVNSSQILGSVTQDVNFNGRPQVGAFQAFQTVNRPTLRYLGASNAGGSSTLLLLDGHRLPGMGIFQTTPDLDAITPGAIDRVEVVTGGGSATYGSDAVGGVMNVVSRRRYDGLEVGGHFGTGDSYNQWDVTATAGKTWDNVSVWASYSYAHNDLVHFGDRDYARNRDYINNLPADTSCFPGNVVQQISATASIYFPVVNGAPAAAPSPTGNRCDIFLRRALFPESSRHSAMAGVSAELSDAITFDVHAYYAHRVSTTDNGPLTFSLNGGAPGRSIVGNFSGLFGSDTYASSILETWGVTPQLTARFGGDWRAVAFYNYGQGDSRFVSRGGIDTASLQQAFASGAFNPYTVTFANTPAGQAALATQTNRFGLNRGKDVIHNGRVTFDGPLFSLPGGQLRIAVGGEILYEQYAVAAGSGAIGTPITERANSRTVTALFGELSIPLVGEGNRTTGLYSLTASVAGRYDHYSDFGGTFNPKFGLSWQPVAGWTFRGNWSKSFQAPSLAEKSEVSPATFNSYPANFLGYPSNRQALFLYPGSGPNLRPETATTWEIGTDIKPEPIPGLAISATYYNISFKDRIGNPPFFNGSVFLSQFPNNYILNPTAQQVADFVAQASVGTNNAAPYLADPSLVFVLADARALNLSAINTTGLDFNVNYNRPTHFGSVFGQVSGTYVLTYNVLAFQGGPTSNLNQNSVSPLRLSVMGGTTIGDFMGRVTLQHTSGYHVAPVPAALNQSYVGALDVVNLAFTYNIKRDGWLKDVMLSFNIDNIFDADPPLYNGIVNTSTPGFAGFTLGRVFQVGLRTKF